MLCALLAGCGTIHHPPSEPTLQYNRDAGRTDAHNMLSSLVLPAGERVPPAAQVLTVTRGLARQKPSLTFTTADAAEVQEVAGMLNRLPTVQPGGVNCPNIPVAPTVTFSFRATKNGPVLAQASMPSTGPNGDCPGIAFSIQGKPQRSLSAQPTFLRSAGGALGVTLLTK